MFWRQNLTSSLALVFLFFIHRHEVMQENCHTFSLRPAAFLSLLILILIFSILSHGVSPSIHNVWLLSKHVLRRITEFPRVHVMRISHIRIFDTVSMPWSTSQPSWRMKYFLILCYVIHQWWRNGEWWIARTMHKHSSVCEVKSSSFMTCHLSQLLYFFGTADIMWFGVR